MTKQDTVAIKLGPISLEGNLSIPKNTEGLVIFSHGSGSSRFSPRNNFVAQALNNAGLATLLFDLLTADEEEIDNRTRELRFNIPLLSERLISTTDWVSEFPATKDLNIGYFGSSTGAASALVAAAQRIDKTKAVVSRGGRPDLAGDFLAKVEAPTLLIVGGNDLSVIDMNKDAIEQMHAETKLEIIPGATHLFEEPGTLDQVVEKASEWFTTYLQTQEK